MAMMSVMVILPHVLKPTSAILMSCLLYACVDPCNEQAQRSQHPFPGICNQVCCASTHAWKGFTSCKKVVLPTCRAWLKIIRDERIAQG